MRRDTALLIGLHLAGNALLLLLGYYWLGVGESDGLHLLWSFALLLALTFGALFLHGSALAFFSGRRTLQTAYRLTTRHFPPLLVLALISALLYGVLLWMFHSFDHAAFAIASFVTMTIRKPLSPDRVLGGYHLLLSVLRWLVCPAILFPAAARIAEEGWRGFRWRRGPWLRAFVFSLAVGALLLAAFVLPLQVIAWVPKFPQFGMQMLSVVVRVTFAYLLFVFSLLSIERLTSGGMPVRSQPSTSPLL
jgi:hypothetical protein